MNIHSIILARGGSKGIKNKNLYKINGKPLVYWSILASLRSKKINYTWVSSDSKKILDFSKKMGAKILKRSKRNSSDAASSEKAWLESVKQIELKYQKKIDIIVGVQPTSPIKTGTDFDNAIKIFKKDKLDSLFTSTLINDYCVWSKKINKFSAKYNFKNRKRRQNIDSKYLENGSFYIFETSKFKSNKNRLFGKIGTYVQNKIKSFQIDTYEDIFIVDSIFKNKEIKKYNK
jgi:CMP-N,N'-diacetyllegionaminic acid synthase